MTSVLFTPDGKTIEAEAAHGKILLFILFNIIVNYYNIILIIIIYFYRDSNKALSSISTSKNICF
jgi:hypothetical protein